MLEMCCIGRLQKSSRKALLLQSTTEEPGCALQTPQPKKSPKSTCRTEKRNPTCQSIVPLHLAPNSSPKNKSMFKKSLLPPLSSRTLSHPQEHNSFPFPAPPERQLQISNPYQTRADHGGGSKKSHLFSLLPLHRCLSSHRCFPRALSNSLGSVPKMAFI